MKNTRLTILLTSLILLTGCQQDEVTQEGAKQQSQNLYQQNYKEKVNSFLTAVQLAQSKKQLQQHSSDLVIASNHLLAELIASQQPCSSYLESLKSSLAKTSEAQKHHLPDFAEPNLPLCYHVKSLITIPLISRVILNDPSYPSVPYSKLESYLLELLAHYRLVTQSIS
ncbi:hypothetical protein ACSLBF_02425 [Pseudoalteromonas sp. T1lg65]|uniref:hypothetical protein n=1 Tax=Pseudoalteromonas sp. T1lg65 TaxID=2077101 RepID=UPI003F7B26AF